MCAVMLATFMLLSTLGSAFAGYAGSSSNDVNGGYGYGYSGSFSGNGANIPPGAIPNIPNFDFGSLLNGRGPYSFALTSSTSNANAQAHSSITFGDGGLQQQTEQLAAQNPAYASGFTSYGAPVQDSGDAAKGGSGGGAVASAVLGPKGGYHTAAVYPENPNAPNIFSRFAEPAADGDGGNYGVFTSSVSSSSNVNGKPQNFHRATTTINDNGKISTYTVKNP